jgi:hypothetical protein
MSTSPSLPRGGIADRYEDEVLPALMSRLDAAFPEFGWRRDALGWVASNEEFTHTTLGVRADRVVCHGEAPRGFLIHGERAVLWTTYVNDGQPARGREFVDAVRELASRAGLDRGAFDDARPDPGSRRAALLETAFRAYQEAFECERGEPVRAYLVDQRAFPANRLDQLGLGVVPERRHMLKSLRGAGYSDGEIRGAGVLADDRWEGRVAGAWRDERGRIVTLWARAISDDEPNRYLYLRGASRTGAIPYGLSDLLTTGTPGERHEVILVEGVMDVHQLRAHGVQNVAALGGTSASSALFERLARLDVQRVVLCFDNDTPGRLALARAVDAATRADRAPDLYVIEPARLAAAKDPDQLVRTHGIDTWHAAARDPICAITYGALAHTGGLDAQSAEPERRQALSRAGTWLSLLPARYTVEQDTALMLVADRLSYDTDAVRRAFRARFWRDAPTPDPSRQHSPGDELELCR